MRELARSVQPWQAVLVALAVGAFLLLIAFVVIELRLSARALELAAAPQRPEVRVEVPEPPPRPDLSGTFFDEPLEGEAFAEIPGLGVMDVIGYLKYAPGGSSTVCSGPFSGSGELLIWRCSSGSNVEPIYEVRVVGDNPLSISSVEATVRGASQEQAAAFLGYVAGLCFEETEPVNSAAWVETNVTTGGQLLTAGAELTLYGTKEIRTLVVVGTGVSEQEAESLEELEEIDTPEDFDFPEESGPVTVPEDITFEEGADGN